MKFATKFCFLLLAFAANAALVDLAPPKPPSNIPYGPPMGFAEVLKPQLYPPTMDVESQNEFVAKPIAGPSPMLNTVPYKPMILPSIKVPHPNTDKAAAKPMIGPNEILNQWAYKPNLLQPNKLPYLKSEIVVGEIPKPKYPAWRI